LETALLARVRGIIASAEVTSPLLNHRPSGHWTWISKGRSAPLALQKAYEKSDTRGWAMRGRNPLHVHDK